MNTSGVTLTVFELLTATFAVDEFDLRSDWRGRERVIQARQILTEVSNTDFLQATALLATWERRRAAVESGSGEDRAPGIGCKRKDMLGLGLTEYQSWADPLTKGFENAARFLHSQHLYDARFLPYGSQLIPLAAILTVLGRDWSRHDARSKIARWFWCGVFGELYGGSIETRFARDLPQVVQWIQEGGQEPATIFEAEFAETRLGTLRTRNSAAYKGIYAMLLREGACDWKTGEKSTIQTYFDESVDIHHVFPQQWCRKMGIEATRYDSVVNKTPLTARTNRSIGAKAPSDYLRAIGVPERTLDGYVRTHLIDPTHLHVDDFDGFYTARESELLRAIRHVMGKPSRPGEAEEARG